MWSLQIWARDQFSLENSRGHLNGNVWLKWITSMGIIHYFLLHCLGDPPWMKMVGSDVKFCYEQPGNPEFFPSATRVKMKWHG